MLLLSIVVKNKKCNEFYFPDSFVNTGDSGFDIFFPDDITIPARSTVLVDTGCVFTLSSNGKRLPFYIYPRSSIYKSPIRLANSVGIIDLGYNGNIKLPIDNPSDKDFVITSGSRYFQICSGDLTPIQYMTFAEEKDLCNTQRGSNGFGSTGLDTVSFWQS